MRSSPRAPGAPPRHPASLDAVGSLGPAGAPARSRERGLTLIEVAIATVVLVVAFSGLGGLLIVNERSHATSEEEALATNALRQLAERLRAAPFPDVSATYANYTAQVPEIDGTLSVTIHTNETLATAAAARLGLPRDLDGDGLATNTNVAANYMLLPIRIALTWNGREGNQLRELLLFLAQE